MGNCNDCKVISFFFSQTFVKYRLYAWKVWDTEYTKLLRHDPCL